MLTKATLIQWNIPKEEYIPLPEVNITKDEEQISICKLGTQQEDDFFSITSDITRLSIYHYKDNVNKPLIHFYADNSILVNPDILYNSLNSSFQRTKGNVEEDYYEVNEDAGILKHVHPFFFTQLISLDKENIVRCDASFDIPVVQDKNDIETDNILYIVYHTGNTPGFSNFPPGRFLFYIFDTQITIYRQYENSDKFLIAMVYTDETIELQDFIVSPDKKLFNHNGTAFVEK